MLCFRNGDTFASGLSVFEYRPVSEREKTPRIVVPVILNNNFPTYAFVDTGGVYCLCSPEIGGILKINAGITLGVEKLKWRGRNLDGTLHRLPITISAEEGKSLNFEATFFIPQLDTDIPWEPELDCILGMYLCLERIRFAVDPSTDTFYFGALN